MFQHINILINLIVSQYLANYQCVVYLSENNLNIVSQNIPSITVNIAKRYKDNAESEGNYDIALVLNNYCQMFVIQSEDPVVIFEYLEEKILKVTKTVYKYNIRKYLFLISNIKKARKLLTSSYLDNVFDVLIVSLDKSKCRKRYLNYCDEIYSLWTHPFVGSEHSIRFLDQWYSTNQSFKLSNNLYPDKANDMNGKILKISTYTLSPYSIVGDSLEQSHGVDMKLLSEFVRKYKLTPHLIIDPNKDWGLPYGNQTKATGTLKQVVNGLADIVVGGLVYWPGVAFDVDTTSVYYQCTVKCFVPIPGLLKCWTLLIYPFNITLWIIFLSAIFMSTIIYYISTAHRFRNRVRVRGQSRRIVTLTKVVFDIIKIYLQQSTRLSKQGRIFTFLLLLLSLYFIIIYNSGLASLMMQSSRQPSISRIEDIIDQNLRVGTTSIPGYANTIIYDEKERYKKFSRLLFEANQTELLHMLHFKNISILVDKTLGGHYAVSDYEKSDIFTEFEIMREDILKMYIVGMTKKHWVLLPHFNKLADRIFEAGLVYYWDQEAIRLTSLEKIQTILKIRDVHHSTARTLKMFQVKGIFAIWSAGILASAFVFIFEKYLFSKQK